MTDSPAAPQDVEALDEAVEIHEAELPEVEENDARTPGGQLDMLLDTVVQVSVCMGQAEVRLADLIELAPGAVLKLDKQVGEPLDLYLRGKRFALGELVLIGDQLGVRVRQVLPA